MSQEYYGVKLLAPLVGFFLGAGFMTVINLITPEDTDVDSGGVFRTNNMKMLFFGVTLHNLPEGMAVGIVYAGILSGETAVSLSGAAALSLGIAVQNIPEGAIISMPLKAEGVSRSGAFLRGALSGIVEPIGALITLAAAKLVLPALPYFLSFAAGAMLYVVVEELIPEMSAGEHSNIGTVFFAVGFCLMMILDVALG